MFRNCGDFPVIHLLTNLKTCISLLVSKVSQRRLFMDSSNLVIVLAARLCNFKYTFIISYIIHVMYSKPCVHSLDRFYMAITKAGPFCFSSVDFCLPTRTKMCARTPMNVVFPIPSMSVEVLCYKCFYLICYQISFSYLISNHIVEHNIGCLRELLSSS